MKFDKAEYEKLIDASPLFLLDRNKEYNAYRREALKMVEYLYCYLMAINSDKYEPYGVEIVETAKRCINNYKPESGRFLNYFCAAWKQEYSHICGNEIIDNKFQGMKLSEQDKRNIKKYMRILSRKEEYKDDDTKYKKIAELMGITVDEVIWIAGAAEIKVIGSVTSNSEGEEISLIDNKADDFIMEDYFDNLATMVETLDKIELVFNGLQDRQKAIVSDMITIKIGLDICEIEKISKNYSFLSKEVTKIIKDTGKIPTQRDIAEKYCKNEASISRTIKEFINKLRKEV